MCHSKRGSSDQLAFLKSLYSKTSVWFRDWPRHCARFLESQKVCRKTARTTHPTSPLQGSRPPGSTALDAYCCPQKCSFVRRNADFATNFDEPAKAGLERKPTGARRRRRHVEGPRASFCALAGCAAIARSVSEGNSILGYASTQDERRTTGSEVGGTCAEVALG